MMSTGFNSLRGISRQRDKYDSGSSDKGGEAVVPWMHDAYTVRHACAQSQLIIPILLRHIDRLVLQNEDETSATEVKKTQHTTQ